MKIVSTFVAAFVAAALGMPMSDVIHEKRDDMPSHMLKRSVAADTLVPVRIALKQRNLESGMDFLMDVSDPDSANYGKHWTSDQVAAMFRPSQDSVDVVRKWLVEAGIPGSEIRSTKSNGWLQFRTTVSQLEEMLQTRYSVYENKRTRSEHLGTDGYSLPRAVSEHVDFITPGVAMLKKRSSPGRGPARPFKSLSPAEATTGCDTQITPACIKSLYNITAGTLSNASNRLGIFESDDEEHRQSDLDKFYSTYATNIPKGFGPKIDLIDWPKGTSPNPNNAEGEAALDFQVSIPIIYPQSTELYQSHDNYDGSSHLGFLDQWLDAIDGSFCTYEGGDPTSVDGTTPNEMCGTFTPTHVISISYGLTEADWPTSYLQRQCDEFMKLGLQGTSIVFSSGDGGVAGGHGGDCQGNGNIFNPPAPVSCPYTTAVGATLLPKGTQPGGAETATVSFASGGGFSNIWTTPSYQQSAVATFFSQHDPGFASYNTSNGVVPTSGGIYNRAGRGFPDVAAVGDNGLIIFDGSAGLIGGTSMSAPIFAAILTRINEERIAAGKVVIGFANPALYKNPSMFHDITKGNQNGGSGTCAGKGFSAVAGWDPVTGLGTPNYPAMLSYFLSLS
ncbi:putative alkaline serine protease AorO [Thozetella sp. PMI_491]|nr:putative alkaline serine protease AorO [Thozetella sp. PMI_491]